MQDATTSGTVSPGLSDGITLAGASAYMYLATFSYELGYCTYFGVPSSLIVPSISTLLFASLVISSVLLPSLFWLGFTLPLFRAAEEPSLRPYSGLIRLLAWSSAGGVILSVIYGLSFRGLMIFVVAVLGIVAFLFVPAVLSNRHLAIPQRLEENAELQAKDPFDITPLLARWIAPRLLIGMALSLVLLGVAFLVGDAEARSTEQFLALKSNPNLIVLRRYEEVLILAPIEPNERLVENEIQLLTLGESASSLVFIHRETGPLSRRTLMSLSERERMTDVGGDAGSPAQ